MSDIFDDPKVKANLLRFLEVNSKVKEKVKLPYYTKEFAQTAKVLIDKVLETKTPIRLDAKGISPITLRLQFYQGAKYLRDQNDKYKDISRYIKCATYQNYIELSPRKFRYNEHAEINLSTTSPIIHNSNWKDELITFITSMPDQGTKYHEKNVILSPDDIQWAQSQLLGLEAMFLSKVLSNEILVIRHDS